MHKKQLSLAYHPSGIKSQLFKLGVLLIRNLFLNKSHGKNSKVYIVDKKGGMKYMEETIVYTFTFECDIPAKSEVTIAFFYGNGKVHSETATNTGDTSTTFTTQFQTTNSPVGKVVHKINKL
ncbi:hypothetical protein [Bacillus wiedmannii]|uniref:hypothetical protein n=1 Tax=Bacillus wiedmannii TaxID=1890302 RepID=UPI001D0E3071|nr:hypothetical protein [Bacillus wiedmannii]MCC2327600.1 hypothetical protein [Bacillus wiedmannii]